MGYGVYDLYDLGEFDQKGTVRTKYGTKTKYLKAIAAAHAAGIQIYADVVFNHKMGADLKERVKSVRIARDNRNHEYGGDVWIDAWTGFDFSARRGKYSSFKWRWYHFDGTDWADDLREEGTIYKFRGIGKSWDWENTVSDLPADTHIEWKCLKKDDAGNVQWQPGENNRFTTPRSGTGNTSGTF